MLSQMLVGLPAGEMTPEDATSMKRAMALYGLGSVFKGDDASPTLQSMMMMDMARSKNAKEEAEKRRIQSEIGSIWGNPMAQSVSTSGTPAKNSYGLDMGRSSLPKGNTTTVGDTTYDMGQGTVPPVDGKMFANVSDPAKQAWQRLNASWGKPLNISSAYRDPATNARVGGAKHSQHMHGNAFDVPVPGMSQAEQIELIKEARRAGFTGVGVYGNSLHFDTGPSRYWGPDYGASSLPEWARAAVTDPIDANTQPVVSTSGDARPAQSTDFSLGNVSGQQFQGALLPMLQQQQGQARQQPTQGVRVAQSGTDWRQIALNIRNSNLPPEEKQRQFQQLRLMMQIEKVQQGDRLTGKERYMNVDGVLYDVSGDKPRAVTERTAKPSAADAKINRIMTAYGVDQRTATGIADGVLRVSRDPYTDAIQVTNLATNEVWTPSARGGEQVTQRTDEETRTQPDLTFGNPYKGAEDVFGLEGMARGALNAVTDFVTGQEIFPEAAQATRDFELLREDITQDLQSAYGQRVPSWALKALRDLAPSPGGFQGAGSAQGQLRALGRRFQSELQAAEQSLRANNRGMSPEDEAKANAKISALRRSMEKINQALGGFEADGAENETSSGVKWRVVQ